MLTRLASGLAVTVVALGAAAAPALAAPDPLARDLQTELARVGCYGGPIDGLWGPQSRGALAAFDSRTARGVGALYPTERAYRIVASASGRVCGRSARLARADRPVYRGGGDGRCVVNNVPRVGLTWSPYVIWGTQQPCRPPGGGDPWLPPPPGSPPLWGDD